MCAHVCSVNGSMCAHVCGVDGGVSACTRVLVHIYMCAHVCRHKMLSLLLP